MAGAENEIDWGFHEALKVNAQDQWLGPDRLEDESERKLGDFTRLWTYLGISAEAAETQRPEDHQEKLPVKLQPQEKDGSASHVRKSQIQTILRATNRKNSHKDALDEGVNHDRFAANSEEAAVHKAHPVDQASQKRRDVIKDILNISPITSRTQLRRSKLDSTDGVRFQAEEEGMTSKDEGTSSARHVKHKSSASSLKVTKNTPWIYIPEKDGSSKVHSGYDFEDLDETFAVTAKTQLIKSLISEFPQNSTTLRRLLTGPTRQISTKTQKKPTKTFVFVDISNIKISLQDKLKSNRGLDRESRIRARGIQFFNLTLILERGRDIRRRCLVGSRPLREVREAEGCRYECKLLEMVRKAPEMGLSSGPGYTSGSDTPMRRRRGEQAVDELLNMCMLESLLDNEPATLVLASGDAAVGEFSAGFLATVERALGRGWFVEVMGFSKHTSNLYFRAAFRERWKKQFQFVNLDPYAELLAAR